MVRYFIENRCVAQAIEVIRLIDGRELDEGQSPFAVDVGIAFVLCIPPPLVRDSDDGGGDSGGEKTTINKQRECQRQVVDTSMTAGDDKQ